MPVRRIVFWQDSLSIHQAPLVRELSNLTDAELVVVTEKTGLGGRRGLGWETPDYGRASVCEGMPETDLTNFVHGIGLDSVHIVTGVGSYKKLKAASKLLLESGSPVLFQSEAWDPRGIAGTLRQAIFRHRRWMVNRYDNASVLAMGEKGRNAFVSAGYSAKSVVEFAYFTDSFNGGRQQSPSRDGLLFVGSLCHRKGLDILFQALELMLYKPRVTIVGSGPEEKRLAEMAADLESVRFIGPIKNRDIGGLMAQHHALVLPSRHDGWGAVVNEALLAGTPVICSSDVGASSFVGEAAVYRGTEFKSGDPQQLKDAIEGSLVTADQNPAMNEELEKWSMRCISARAGAEYLLEITEAVLSGEPAPRWPTAPWRRF